MQVLNKQALKFLKRKYVKQRLCNHTLTEQQIIRLNNFFSRYSCKETENMHYSICCFILNDLNNYIGRYCRLKKITGTTLYSQFLRYGRIGIEIYKKQVAKNIKNLPNCLDYWINLGYSIDDAKNKIKEVQSKRGNIAAQITTGSSEYTIRSIQYWLRKGFTELAAKEKVKNIQTKNGSAFYIQKYGEIEGKKKYDDRIIKWLSTLNNKNDEEKQLINLKKGWSIEGLLTRGFSPSESLDYYNKQVDNIKSLKKRYSNISQHLFYKLLERLTGTMYFAEHNGEYYINKRPVDFFHKESRICIEFYGDYWHRNPILYVSNSILYNTVTSDIWDRDKKRNVDISQYINKLIIVWELEYRKNPTECIDNLLTQFKGYIL